MKRALVLTWLVVFAGLLGAGCGSTFRATRDFSLSEAWEDYARIEVRTRNGRVELASGASETITISGRKQAGGLTMAEAEENVERLTIHAAADEARPDTFVIELEYPEDLSDKSIGASFTIEIPAPCAADVKTSNGSIRVEQLLGPVALTTSNGRIEATSIDGDLRARSSNGRITAASVTGAVTLETSNGAVEVEDVHDAVDVQTSNGRIEASVDPGQADHITLRTSNGAITLSLPSDLAAELALDTSNGRINVGLSRAELSVTEAERNHLHGTMNGGGCQVTARTSNGAINVKDR